MKTNNALSKLVICAAITVASQKQNHEKKHGTNRRPRVGKRQPRDVCLESKQIGRESER